jgi:hypothetical protein
MVTIPLIFLYDTFRVRAHSCRYRHGAWTSGTINAKGAKKVRVGILGPLEVRDAAGSSVSLAGSRLRALLVRLAVADGRATLRNSKA